MGLRDLENISVIGRVTTNPCGTPASILHSLDNQPSIFTRKLQSLRYDAIILIVRQFFVLNLIKDLGDTSVV